MFTKKEIHLDNAIYTKPQLTALVLLRVLIGWHFLYEGIAKVLNPSWSSVEYLWESKWIFSGIFHTIAANTTMLKVVDSLNEWGLIAIGAGLIAGFLTQIATVSGIILLFLYYICNPPFIGLKYSMPAEGSYLIVNKNLIEIAALFVLMKFQTGNIIGFDFFVFKRKHDN